ncbi:MAG: glycosyltransferase family 4 protein [Alphaproteobacteria bacterium]|nr:glycosyltransferase family 4 protein [Alphaproteobacteria bacterium]
MTSAGEPGGTQPPLRILMVNSTYDAPMVGGAQRSVRLLAEALASRGHRVVVLCLTSEPRPTLRRVGGLRVLGLPIRNLYWPFGSDHQGAARKLLWHAVDSHNPIMSRLIARVVRATRSNIVHSNAMSGLSTAIWTGARSAGATVVHTLRDYHTLCPRTSVFRNGRSCRSRCADCRALSWPRVADSGSVNAVVGNSRHILDRHLGAGAFKTASVQRVISGPIDLHAGSGDRGGLGPGPVRKPGDPPLRLGFLGKLSAEKGIEELCRAVSDSGSERCGLIIAGDGDGAYVDRLRASYEGSAVRFLGRIDDPTDVLRRIDALVVPSVWEEPLSRTIFEAYGAGVPVIVSNRGGNPEAVDPGVTGFVVDPEQPQAFSGLLCELAAAPERLAAMRPAAFAKADCFSQAKVAKAYEAVYYDTRTPRGVPGLKS